MKEFNSFNVYSKVEYVEMLESLQRKAKDLSYKCAEKDAENNALLREVESLRDRLKESQELVSDFHKRLRYWHDRHDARMASK